MLGTILLVEDNDYMQEWIAYELEADGYRVIAAVNGEAGLKAAQKSQKPDLILLDVQLPKMDGFQVSKALQADPQTANIPIIFLTARDTLNDKVLGFDAGGIDYLIKPFNMVELKARIKAILRQRDIGRVQAQVDVEIYKSDLADNMNHELLTPMAKILSALDIVSKAAKAGETEELEKYVEAARGGAYELRWLIEDLLMVHKLGNQQVEPFRQGTDLVHALHALHSQVQAQYQKKSLQFDIKLPESYIVNMNFKHLQHILHHLLDNACKFSPHKGRVRIGLQTRGQHGANIIIQDQGPGIEPELLKQIFDRFYQTDMSINRSYGGLGIGLYLARTLARLYQGDIIINSRLGAGTVCRFQIPDTKTEWNA